MSLKGTIVNIQQFSVNDGPGIRTTVFFKGCPLSCWWCHNPESISKEIITVNGKTFGREYTVEELYDILQRDMIFFDESGGGVTFSGGEPLSQVKFLKEIMIRCNNNGIHTAVDTSGFANQESLKKIIPYTDIFLYDLKIMDPDIHQKYTSVSNSLILKNLEYLVKNEAKIIIRIPLIPDITFESTNLEKMIRFLKNLDFNPEINLLPFHRIAEGKYKRLNITNRLKGKKELSDEEIFNIAKRFQSNDFKVKVGG